MRENVTLPENPSAGKFDAPPAPLTPRQSRAGGWRIFAATLALVILLAQWLLPAPRGWAAFLFVGLAFAVMILEWLFLKKESDERGPYTERDHIAR